MCRENDVNEGFTFVELLVCIAILAIISMPLLNGFLVAGRTNEKARNLQRATTLAQNLMETIKGQSFTSFRGLLQTEDYVGLQLTEPYDMDDSYITALQEDPSAGTYSYCIHKIKEGTKWYDAFITLDTTLYRSVGAAVQNTYQYPRITNLTGSKVAVVDQPGASSSWNSYIDGEGNTIYAKDVTSSMDQTIASYFYMMHMSYLDYLSMQDPEVPLPTKYPYSYEQIKQFMKKEIIVVAENGCYPDGSRNNTVVSLVGKVVYSIPGIYEVTGDTMGLSSEYQILSKSFETTDGTNPLEKIYVFYEKGDTLSESIVLQNNTTNDTALYLIGQDAGTISVKCTDTANTWKIISNRTIVFQEGSKTVSSELVEKDTAMNRLFEAKIEIYESSAVLRGGKKCVELLSSKEE
ncbi:type IV pilus modification PilV family protein [Anaerosporobacter faecicola]|uniref:type IV pilus modification PilV family protein n=1 Tax=Anaerosporobacter faecicola TaxID=2718714 RepID=UPI00143C96E6|nr:type II secretion system protein [Anaerosporobacter faecicola]